MKLANKKDKTDKKPAASAKELLKKGPYKGLIPGRTYVQERSVFEDFRSLLFKIVLLTFVVFIIFSFIFGIYREPNGSMMPAIHEGDLVLTYKWTKSLKSGDVTVVKYNDEMLALRVVATEGDTVAIGERGLLINDNYRVNNYSSEATRAVRNDIEYPITLGEGEVFLLGDAREHSTDSRVFGVVRQQDTEGIVFMQLRLRGF